MNKKNESLLRAYLYAKFYVIRKGYASEIDWQESRDVNSISENELIGEAVWVILSAGLNYKTVIKKHYELSGIFGNYKNINHILENRIKLKEKALNIFNYEKKIDAILQFIYFINEHGVETFKYNLVKYGAEYLMQLPYFGPATSMHFLKNIGINASKPDRHLNRITKQLGFDTVDHLCGFISKKVDDKKSVIDLIIWRYATLDHNYVDNLYRYLLKNNYTA